MKECKHEWVPFGTCEWTNKDKEVRHIKIEECKKCDATTEVTETGLRTDQQIGV